MEMALVKIFATALALSEVIIEPQAVKTHFDPINDRDRVVQLLRAGCAHVRKAFGIESIDLDDLISTAFDDPQVIGPSEEAFYGIKFIDLNTAYHQFCKSESIGNPIVDVGKVIEFYDRATADLPDPTILRGKKLPGMSMVFDGAGQGFAEIFEPGNRRIWVSLSDIPDNVQKAFIAAEDRRFFQHHGVDERGIVRAFVNDLGDPGRPQGGSTITQQVVKNLLVGGEATYERKIREMLSASRLEIVLTKREILELYLNCAYFGRGSSGIEAASRSYFGKSAKDLSLSEAAMLAALIKGPSYFGPDRHPDRAKERLAYVLGRMREDGDIDAEQKGSALAAVPKVVPFDHQHRNTGFQFVDYLNREAKLDGIDSLTAESYAIHSTLDAQLQRDTEAALQEGLAQYEISTDRTEWHGPEANVADAVRKIAADGHSGVAAWQQALQAVQLPLYDVHWTPAVIVQKSQNNRSASAIRVGLPDGRITPLKHVAAETARSLSLYDVAYVHVDEGKQLAAELRMRPTVQGAALVLENRTGRILAMAGSFSYPLSQLNRTWQTERQPGSAIKPVTYVTALQKGLQPNTVIQDEPIALPPIGSGAGHGSARVENYWTPRNADNHSGGDFTLRRALEYSRNVITAHLLAGGIDADPEKSLDQVCATAVAAKIYNSCIRYYPFVLGAQPVRMINLAAFYAAVANEGTRPQPHAIDSIELNGRKIFEYPKVPLFTQISAADRASFYQLKTMLQGVVARGTARAIESLSPYVAGKTGTTEDAVDGWFVGFTNDVTIAVWVGYDNIDGKRRSLGSQETGARVALPIFQPIMEAIWARHIAPRAPLNGPSPDAQQHLVDIPIDYRSGDRVSGGQGFVEHFRVGTDGQVDDTQHQMVSREPSHGRRAARTDDQHRRASASVGPSPVRTYNWAWPTDRWQFQPRNNSGYFWPERPN